ncbi:MAG: sugar ABC transporter permease [Acidobacteriota bacterium]|nr:sugar ABC transporter permease [Acidobacteriota bacterium]
MSRDKLSSDTGPGAATRRVRLLALGLLVGLAVGIGLIAWLGSAGRQATVRAAERQSSLIHLSALTDLVQRATAGGEESSDDGGDGGGGFFAGVEEEMAEESEEAEESGGGFFAGVDEESGTLEEEAEPAADVQALVARYVAASETVRTARVVDIDDRMLLAAAGEGAVEQDLPARLTREDPQHKIWYDLGRELRAAVQTNRDDQRLWKEEVSIERREDRGLALAAPLEDPQGEVSGVVLMVTDAEGPVLPSVAPTAVACVLLAVIVFMMVAFPLRRRGRLPQALAAVLAAVALAGFTIYMLGALGSDRQLAEGTVQESLAAAAQHFGASLPPSLVDADAVDPATWDIDRFRQARGIIQGGVIDTAAVDAAFSPVRKRFTSVFALLALLGFGLAAFVGLGGALRLGHTLMLHREAYLFVLPALLGMLVLVFFPFFYGITLSFTGQTLYNLDQPLYQIWIGFENYIDILTDFDLVSVVDGQRTWEYQNFYWTLIFTIIWTVTNVTIGVSVGLILALILNTKGLAFRPIYRVLLILPWAVPNYITALIWKGMFHQQFGVINQVVQMFGGEPVAWFDSPLTAYITVLTTNGWLSFPFMMVVSLGALQSIPSDLYEAARVDGASRWQQFRLVTLPSLKPALVPAIILSVVWTFNQFNIIYLVSEGQPGGATEILITEAYKIAFEQYQYGYAAAYATVIFMILLVYGVWQNRVTGATEGV